ncbi:hypothetical protein NIES2101_41855 [Calothrix sp. HK-06]|nr:hypothetical protein NIES2101_41855 [Calothrix sp. HK-06]
MDSPGRKPEFFIHPGASPEVLAVANTVGHKVFLAPIAFIDYLGLEWKKDTSRLKTYQSFDVHIFFSFKDIEFLFKYEEDYRKFLKSLSRTRRISSKRLVTTDKGSFFLESVSTDYLVKIKDNEGKNRWSRLTIQITDICAMQGNASLERYALNVGVNMFTKKIYNREQKQQMELMYIQNPYEFENYALGDTPLVDIKEATINYYGKVAELVGLEPRAVENFYGLSTGKIVGSLLHEWVTKQLRLPIKEKEDFLYNINYLAGSEGFTNFSKILKSKSLIYLAMVDGGRAVRERVHDCYVGNLIDIDIASCYGSGLKNQVYAVGVPTITNEPINLRYWLRKYKNQLIPGLWYARISWKNSPFKQDLLISKIRETFETWKFVINGYDNEGFEIEDDNKKVYDSSMALTTNSVYQAALNHDLLQVLQYYSSSQEWGWILDNAIIDSSAIYQKKHEQNEVCSQMREGLKLDAATDNLITGTKRWVRVDLSPLMEILINARKEVQQQYGKKSGLDVFLKLIINTIYGVIASEFFSAFRACVSNVVVGNNITARARTLAWCMAKGFHSAMSITDGGVFDANYVLEYQSKSLNIFEQIHRDIFQKPSDKKYVVFQKTLLGGRDTLTSQMYLDHIIKPIDVTEENIQKIGIRNFPKWDYLWDGYLERVRNGEKIEIRIFDIIAWEHLKETFPKLDIFKYNQFSFETKDWYKKLTLHSKVNYRLEKPTGDSVIALRGMPKLKDNDGNTIDRPEAHILFNAIESELPIAVTVKDDKLLSLADWIAHERKHELLPHDTLTGEKVFYSITPLGNRFDNVDNYKKMLKKYQEAKNTGIPIEVAKIKEIDFSNDGN